MNESVREGLIYGGLGAAYCLFGASLGKANPELFLPEYAEHINNLSIWEYCKDEVLSLTAVTFVTFGILGALIEGPKKKLKKGLENILP